ncbi:N-acetyl-gamma-glutamyl-phosphate reductase [Peribacillus cavernae]|uniref:N-acetyl-gamma-glutamyl-phosphate reductase n=1 Tax=Peribacillus cavernae TaxID=1674310 RepID=A0A3S0UF02_9BACI|nr:N-acetyl-gamma-glutamyl-phosphate reductase [Peribacillus cavernae]MDQ0217547.1 N-acetyl-gamma-glutamyl-phosphate reductase [Peribacillus cavernae]RUQ30017.1 N-acetyl-gamma-glutamyl-phosphate reductase [Peribacillus cavernae]
MKVSIVGATGYGGLELIRLLKNHPHFEIASLHTSSKFGRQIHEDNPHLRHLEYALEEIDPEKISKKSEIVFLATPSGVSAKLARAFYQLGVKIIDLSGDLRLKNPEEYEEWYKHSAAPVEVLDEAVYGLSEWNAKHIKQAKIVANPGCYPTATLLGLAPLYTEQWAEGKDVIVDAKSGVSGAGKSPSAGTHYSEINENLKIYKVHQHQHIPEIEQQLANWLQDSGPISFSTHLVPMTRGIMSTMYVKLRKRTTTKELLDLYKTVYEGHPFVRIQPQDAFPCTKQVYGSNFCDIGVAFDERTNKATIVSVIDNLMKGAAGQAVQNANILLGAEETAGLLNIPLYP